MYELGDGLKTHGGGHALQGVGNAEQFLEAIWGIGVCFKFHEELGIAG